METRKEFIERVNTLLATFDPQDLAYNEEEYWMIQYTFEYIEYYAIRDHLFNTAIALHLARGLHDGVHRKLTVSKDGNNYRLPYVIHPMQVCRHLINLHIPIDKDIEDILLATALCHDMIEDLDFKDVGKELYTKYHLDPRIYENVTYLTKRYDFTEEEEEAFFHNIETHPIALLVKLADRGNNVEDLYNMKISKIYEYTEETDRFFVPMCNYGIENHKPLAYTITLLKDKIISLTEIARILVIQYDLREQQLKDKIKVLKEENQALRTRWLELWEEE